MTPSFGMRLATRGIVVALLVTAPGLARAQHAVRVEVRLDSVIGTAAEVPAAQAELGLRAGLQQSARLALLPLPSRKRSRCPAADYRVAGVLWVARDSRTLKVRVLNAHDQRLVLIDSTKAQSPDLADSAAVLGRRVATLLENRPR